MKLVKNVYYGKNGEKKICSYAVSVSKKTVQDAGFTGDENIKVYAKGDKIIVEKEKEN